MTGLELMEAIRGRRPIRKYKLDTVPDEKINAVLEAAMWSPKASERWEFIVVKDADARKKLAKASEQYVGEAPVDIVICSKLKGVRKKNREHARLARAAQNLMLKAYDEDLGTCLVEEFGETTVKDALKIPAGINPYAIICLGYSNEKPAPQERPNIDKLIHREIW